MDLDRRPHRLGLSGMALAVHERLKRSSVPASNAARKAGSEGGRMKLPESSFFHSRRDRSRLPASMRDQHRRLALRARVRVRTKILLHRLEDRFAALMETVGTKMNWVLVFPLTRRLHWFLNRYCPLEFVPKDVHDRARRKRREDVLISLILKTRQLGQPFLKLQFFFTKRRHMIAQRLEVLEGLDHRSDEAGERFEPGEPSHGDTRIEDELLSRPRRTPNDQEREP